MISESTTAAAAGAAAKVTPKHVPIPKNGVDYRKKVVLAPMVRSGELPSRLMALKYGADLVWGPETVDRAIIGCVIRPNPRTSCIEFSRMPSNGQRKAEKTQSSREDKLESSVPPQTTEATKSDMSTSSIVWTAQEPPPPPPEALPSSESVIYRIHPSLESRQLIFQLGTASPTHAVQAATLVAPYVAGIDVNAGCPKPFSTSGGMGAALLSTPDLLCDILTALVQDVGTKFEIGISVKIRILPQVDDTRELVRRLCCTGITGLTVHCRTRNMRKTERAIRDQLRVVSETCAEAGVACVMNGDVEDRAQAEELMREFGVDGAMIATAAEKNPSVFRPAEDGGIASWKEVVRPYMEAAVAVENRWGNTKFLLAQMMPGKAQTALGLSQMKNYEDVCRKLGYGSDGDDVVENAKAVDALLGLTNRLTKSEQKVARKKAQGQEHNGEGKSRNVKQHVQAKRAGDNDTNGTDESRKDKRQKQTQELNGAFHTDLHHDIVAPAINV